MENDNKPDRRPGLEGCDVLGCKGRPNAEGWCEGHATEAQREGLVVRHHEVSR